MVLTCSSEKYLSSSQSLLLVSMWSLKSWHDKVNYMVNYCLTISEYFPPAKKISFIYSVICSFALGVSCLKWEIFMFSILDLISEHHVCVSSRTIFMITYNIAVPSSWALKVYADMKSLNLRLSSVARELLIYRTSILDIKRCWAIIACLDLPYNPAA